MYRKEPSDRRDVQRRRLYDAETRVSEGLVWDCLAAAQQDVDERLASPWWPRHVPSVRCVVLFDHGGKYALAHKGVHSGAIQCPPWARTQLTRFHELAHLANPPGVVGQGPTCAGIYLLLVRHSMGKPVASQLEGTFAVHRVRVQPSEGPRHH